MKKITFLTPLILFSTSMYAPSKEASAALKEASAALKEANALKPEVDQLKKQLAELQKDRNTLHKADTANTQEVRELQKSLVALSIQVNKPAKQTNEPAPKDLVQTLAKLTDTQITQLQAQITGLTYLIRMAAGAGASLLSVGVLAGGLWAGGYFESAPAWSTGVWLPLS